MRIVDIIIFGASGFTGKNCIPVIYKLCNSGKYTLTWAVAGRNESKLRSILQEYEQILDASFNQIKIIIANVADEDSLLRMTSKARCIINCCGPFSLYGEAVVKACIQNGTHHIDVTAEMQYMELIQLQYHEEAQKNNSYVVTACGILSVPGEMGVIHLQKQCPNIVFNSMESYIELLYDKQKAGPGALINIGTLKSAIYVLSHFKQLRENRKKLFPNNLPKLEPELKRRYLPHKNPVTNGWTIFFPATDLSAMYSSQRFFHKEYNQRPIQANTYFSTNSFLIAWTLVILGAIGLFLIQFKWIQKMVLKFPEIFSVGFMSNTAPTEDAVRNTGFRISLLGRGWKQNSMKESLEFSDKETLTEKVVCTIEGGGYTGSCVCAVLAAIIILTESEKLPLKGGVFTPGAAFAKTSIIEQLIENDVKYVILADT